MQPLALTWAVYFLLLACVSAFVLPRATRTGFRRALCGFRAANSSKDACDSVFEFRELGSVIEANLAKKGIVEPTPIQLEGWKVILQDDSSNVLLSAETAAGKTLAYTLPLLHLMTTEAGILKVASSPLSQKTLVVNPRTVIMLPNSLLVHQVHQVLSELVRDTGLRVDMVDNIETQEMPDVVIGTPQKLLSKFDVYNLNFKVDVFQNIAYLVLDEADQLVEQTSEACLRRFLALANKRVKTILAAATVSTAGRRSTKNCIDRLFKNLNVLSTDRVHALPTNLEPSFVYCTGYEQKVEKLLEILGEMKPQQRALVFCGTVKSSEALYDILKKTHRNLDVGLINRCVDVETQLAVVDEQHGNKVIICTDVLARGIDIPRVSKVVQFDFPTNVLDYIHRSGRAGRNMQRCKASLLWTDADRDFFTLLSDNRDNLPALFSRKRGLRKRLKRGVPVGDTLARSGGEDLNDKM